MRHTMASITAATLATRTTWCSGATPSWTSERRRWRAFARATTPAMCRRTGRAASPAHSDCPTVPDMSASGRQTPAFNRSSTIATFSIPTMPVASGKAFALERACWNPTPSRMCAIFASTPDEILNDDDALDLWRSPDGRATPRHSSGYVPAGTDSASMAVTDSMRVRGVAGRGRRPRGMPRSALGRHSPHRDHGRRARGRLGRCRLTHALA